MFDAIVNRRIDLEGIECAVHMADIEVLNRAALAGLAQVTKISYYAYAHCVDQYALLDAGSALGRNCGPLLISKRHIAPDHVATGRLRIAIPGRLTTANLLLGLAFPDALSRTEVTFSQIEAALLEERFDAGVIIHENRFTYETKGLRRIVDLGEVWERQTGAPIPLGAMAVSRALPEDLQRGIERLVRRSVAYALAHRHASLSFVRRHAQEMRLDVIYRHIDTYVNEFSIDLGDEGRRAVRLLFDRAVAGGIIPPLRSRLFLS